MREAGPTRRARSRGASRRPVGEREARRRVRARARRRIGRRGGRGVLEAVDVPDVRVIERREHLRFPPESREAIRIGRKRVRQDLQRDVAIELRVSRAIDLAHAARADQLDDRVRTEGLTGLERVLPYAAR